MRGKQAAWLGFALAGAAVAAFTSRAYRRDMQRAWKRISGGSRIAETSRGRIEYASVGEGFPLLVVHGAGGGFDQLRAIESEAHLSALGFRLLFVSRFGYLRTPLPDDASTRAQADAYAALLDTLGIERAGVIAASAGAPSGLRFAAQYPERCAALVLLVPAAFVPGSPAVALPAPPWIEYLRNLLLQSDFAFWLATKVARDAMVENVLGTPPEAARKVCASERERLDGVLMDILPVSERQAGLGNDAIEVKRLEPTDVAGIRVPMLVISAEDDLYGTARCARYLAGQSPGARLVIFPDGGHLWAGHEEELRREVTDFLGPLGASHTAWAPG